MPHDDERTSGVFKAITTKASAVRSVIGAVIAVAMMAAYFVHLSDRLSTAVQQKDFDRAMGATRYHMDSTDAQVRLNRELLDTAMGQIRAIIVEGQQADKRRQERQIKVLCQAARLAAEICSPPTGPK